MPEQAEWNGKAQYNPDFGIAVDGDDYTWHAPVFDTRTADQKVGARMQALETTVAMLVDEVQHLREDIARMVKGASNL